MPSAGVVEVTIITRGAPCSVVKRSAAAVALAPFEGAVNRLEAVVRDTTFLGPVARLRLVLAGDQAMTVDLHGEGARELPEAGAAVLRAHDVAETVQALRVTDAIRRIQ